MNKKKALRTDGGTEYRSNRLKNWLENSGITHQTTAAYTPQQNGVSERLNRTAMESTRSTIYMRTNKHTNLFKNESNPALELWGEFLRSAVYVLNRTISSSSTITPFELLFGRKPNIENLRVIGCRAYAHVPDAKRKKLDAKATPCWLVGYGEETKGWILWDPESRKYILSRDVTFNENLLIGDVKEHKSSRQKDPECSLFDPFLLATKILGLVRKLEQTLCHEKQITDYFFSPSPTTNNYQDLNNESNTDKTTDSSTPTTGDTTPTDPSDETPPNTTDDVPENTLMEETQTSPTDETENSTNEESFDEAMNETAAETTPEPTEQNPSTPVYGRSNGKSNRIPQYNARYNEYRRSLGIQTKQLGLLAEFKAKHASALLSETFEPQSYKQAMECDSSEKWTKAFQEEYDSLVENGTWKLVPLPPGCSTINCKWIGRVKAASEGVPERYKGRLVAIGTRQRYGIDYDEVFSPVPHQEAVKAALSEIAALNLEVMQLDVKTAFLHATLDKTIYMKQPEGFICPGKEDHVCLLLKSLYGLKQAPRLWFGILDKALGKFGLKNSSADKCIYVLRTKDVTIIAIVHVDDFIIGASSKNALNELRTYLDSLFQIRTVPPTRFIGIDIIRDQPNRRMFLTQEHMIVKLAERFNMADLHPKVIPADPTKRLKTANPMKSEGEMPQTRYPYREAVGALLYLALSTRPDISYAVSQIAKHCQNPDATHWEAVIQILAYLKGTKDLRIWLGGKQDGIVGYSDADFAGDINDRSSTSGSIFFFRGGPVAWSSKKQTCIALSTTEAEYVAACEATKTAVWLRCLLQDFTGKEEQIPVMCDNQGAVKLVYNPEFHPKTKHIALRYHFIRRATEEKKINVDYVATKDQLADIFTKPLPGPVFMKMRKRIGVGRATE